MSNTEHSSIKHTENRWRQAYFKYRKAFLILAVLLLGLGGLVFYRTFAASCDVEEKDENRCWSTNTYSDYRIVNKAGGYDSLTWDIIPHNEPPNGQGVYFSTTFGFTPTPADKGHGGYAGIQKTADGKKIAIFSIWDAEAAYPLEGKQCINAKDKFSYGNSECEVVDYEPPNNAYSVRLKYDWQNNTAYRFKVEKMVITPELSMWSGRPAGTYFVGTILDTSRRVSFEIGSIRVKPHITGITGNYNGTKSVSNFTEFVGAVPPGISDCKQVGYVAVTFTEPIFNNQPGLARLPTQEDFSYQPNRNCVLNSKVTIENGTQFKHERGNTVFNPVHNGEYKPSENFASFLTNVAAARRYAGSDKLNDSPLIHFTGYRQNPNVQQPIPTQPTNPPPLPPIPTCGSGATDPRYLPNTDTTPNPSQCDDGNWRLYFDVWIDFGSTKEHFIYYQRIDNPGICGTKSGAPEGTLPHAGPYYMYEQNCSDLDVIKKWIAMQAINKIGPKINAIQDVKPNAGGVGPAKTTDAKYANFNMRHGGMRTWPSYQKPDQGAVVNYFPGYLPLPNFIPDPHGYLNVNSKENFWGNVWGWMDGRYVAASNMKPGSAFVFGPFENPGGNISVATMNGRKAMKVCWTIKDIKAAETGNTQHSLVRLQVTSNGGSFNFTPAEYSVYQLKGTGFSEYCQDNIRINDIRVQNLEYPVTLVSGSIAVSNVSRTIYWPEGPYTIDLPSNSLSGLGVYGVNDPIIKQAGVQGTQLYKNQCAGVPYVGGVVKGCKLTATTNIRVTSSVFGAKKTNGTKELCVVARLPQEKRLVAYFYGVNEKTPGSHVTLRFKTYLWDLSGRAIYCGDTRMKTFNSTVLSTDITDPTNPAIVESLTIH